jgi:hypothetical protein
MNAIKSFALGAMLMLACGGCMRRSSADVTFEWFNLSTNEIWITDVAGIPKNASCGRLVSSPAEDQIHAAASAFSETVRIADRITITWIEGGKEGWPGGLKPGQLVPPGIPHTVGYKRDDLGLPPKLETAIIRFTYLGSDKWRITSLE